MITIPALLEQFRKYNTEKYETILYLLYYEIQFITYYQELYYTQTRSSTIYIKTILLIIIYQPILIKQYVATV